jgi:hypothetical protein
VRNNAIVVQNEIEGVEMGVFRDGSAFLTERGLARLCGVDQKSVSYHAKAWREGKRERGVARTLTADGYIASELYTPLSDGSYAFPEVVCMAFLKHYALDAKKPTEAARQTMGRLLQAGLRFYIYGSLGYDPGGETNALWEQFHDRMSLNPVPQGYFSIFKEGADLVVRAIQGGLAYGSETIPDISIGQAWSRHWKQKRLAEKYGERHKHPHQYPDYFPQSRSRFAIEAWIYPDDALPAFRGWLNTEYAPKHFTRYLAQKGVTALPANANAGPGLAKTFGPGTAQRKQVRSSK